MAGLQRSARHLDNHIRLDAVAFERAATDAGTSLDGDWLQLQRWQGYVSMARNVSLGVAALVVLALGWLILRRFGPAASKSGAETAEDEQERQRRLDEIATVAKQNPEAIARVLTTWLDGAETPSKAAA